MVHKREWYDAYENVLHELDDDHRRQLCEQARTLIQERLLACKDNSEHRRLERALRELWVLENPGIELTRSS